MLSRSLDKRACAAKHASQPVVQATLCHSTAVFFCRAIQHVLFMNVKHTPGIQDFVLTFRGVFWYPKMEPPPEPVGSQG